MNTTIKTTVSTLLILSLASGCATMSDSEQTQAQGLGIGVILGSVIGAAVGHATGNDASDSAVVGGLLGGMAGSVYGEHVAAKKAQYASEEDYLDACVAEAAKARQDAETFNLALQQDLDAMDAQAAELLASIESGKTRKTELDALRARGTARLADAEIAMKRLNVDIALQREVLEEEGKKSANGERLAKLLEQVEGLEQQKVQLEQRTQRLASINNRMSV